MESRSLRIRLALAVALGVPTALSAGVFEIDQRCVAVGCFPGDFAGFPVTISSPGEYRLTSNLDTRFSPTPADLTAITKSVGPGAHAGDRIGLSDAPSYLPRTTSAEVVP